MRIFDKFKFRNDKPLLYLVMQKQADYMHGLPVDKRGRVGTSPIRLTNQQMRDWTYERMI